MRNTIAMLTLALTSGCGDEDKGGRYTLVVERLPPGTAIVVAGKLAGTLDASRTADVVLPKNVYLAGGASSVIAKAATPCGLVDIALAPDRFTTLDYERSARSMTEPMRAALELPEATKVVTVWVDRSQEPSAKVSLGSMVLDRASEVHGRIDVVWPACADQHTATIDGREIGTLPIEPTAGKDLVVATVPACYRMREVAYSSGTYARGADDVVFERAQLLWVSPLTYFLEDAPQTISSRDAGELRGELQRVECPRSVGVTSRKPGVSDRAGTIRHRRRRPVRARRRRRWPPMRAWRRRARWMRACRGLDLKHLEQSGLVRRMGQGRTTRWMRTSAVVS